MDFYQRLLLGTIIPWLNPNQQPETTTSFWPISSFHIYHHLYQALNVFFTSSKTPLFNPLIKWDIHDIHVMYTCGGFLKWVCPFFSWFNDDGKSFYQWMIVPWGKPHDLGNLHLPPGYD